MKKKRKWLQILKKRKKFVIPLTIILAVGIGAGIFVVGRGRSMRTMAGAMAAQTAEVTKGNISTTVIGTGNLESVDAENVYLPEGVEVEEVLVSSGDHVEEGTVLAKLDAASITSEMLSIQEEISELDEDLNDVKDDTESDTVTTKISGRVKEIYAQEGTSVAETMADKGALMVLSVDGKMAVELKNVTTVSLGDTVTVILSDGSTEKEGTVASLDGTTCLVTLTDKGTTFGELVTVQDGDGKNLGNGKLTIHQPLEITAVAGTVKSIKVSEGDAVDAGDTLATLEDVPASAEYQELAARREKLTERLKSLIELSETNTLTAGFSGTVQGVYVSDGSKAESSSSTAASSETSSANTQGGTVIGTRTSDASSVGKGNSASAIFINTDTANRRNTSIALRTVSTETESEKDQESSEKPASTILITSITNVLQAPVSGAAAQTAIAQTECTGTVVWTVGGKAFSGSFDQAVSYTAKVTLQAAQGYAFATDDSLTVNQDGASSLEWKVTEQTAEITIQFAATDINSCSLTITAPKAGASPQTAIDGTAAYSGTISWSPQATVFAANAQYIATVKLTAYEGYRFAGTDQMTVTLNGSRVSQVSVSEDASQITMILVYQIGENGKSEEPSSESQTTGMQQTENSQQKEGQQTNSAQRKNENQQTEGQETGKTTISPSVGVTTGGTGSSSAAVGVSGSGTGSGSSSATSDTAQSTQEDVETAKVTAFTISPEENMNLSVSVDELDILSIELDQKADITFDAIEDEVFEGTITSISDTASVNGGVAKYTVTITLPKNESMKVGMNASATITIEDKQDILLIPVSALQERGDKVFVYTQQEEESGALSGEVEVETGLSDGSNVEITEGLSEGDVVYYTRTALEEGESGFNMERMDGMGGGSMGDQMPFGGGPSGERPSGGGPGGQ